MDFGGNYCSNAVQVSSRRLAIAGSQLVWLKGPFVDPRPGAPLPTRGYGGGTFNYLHQLLGASDGSVLVTTNPLSYPQYSTTLISRYR